MIEFKTAVHEGHKVEKPKTFFARLKWALFENADDGEAPDSYDPPKTLFGIKLPEKIYTSLRWKKLCWWTRNPCHNLTFYEIGCVDKNTVAIGKDPTTPFVLPTGWNWSFVRVDGTGWPRPFVSHAGKKRRWYIGWRPPGGAFGFKYQPNRD